MKTSSIRHGIIGILIAVMIVMIIPATVSATTHYTEADLSYNGRTKTEIAQKYNEAMAVGPTYSSGTPSTYYSTPISTVAPYSAGAMSQDTLDAMGSMTDYYRWLVGVAPVTRAYGTSEALQAGALIRNWSWGHTVDISKKPEDMSDDLWQLGANVSHNILSSGTSPSSSIENWLDEGYNVRSQTFDTVGHRYSLISARRTGLDYGYAGSIAIGKFYSGGAQTQPFYPFPCAGNSPNNAVYTTTSAWSVELNSNMAQISNLNNIVVTVTDNSTEDSYECTYETNTLNYDNSYSYSLQFAQPYNGRQYTDGNSFHINITGLTSPSGDDVVIDYDIDFFDMSSERTKAYKATACESAVAGSLEYGTNEISLAKGDSKLYEITSLYDGGLKLTGSSTFTVLDADKNEIEINKSTVTLEAEKNAKYYVLLAASRGATDFNIGVTGWGIDESGVLEYNGTGAFPQNLITNEERVTKVVLCEGVTAINSYALQGFSNMKEVVLPSTLTSIGSSAFKNCFKLEKIEIPENVASIGSYAFDSCNALAEVKIHGGAINVSSYAFYRCIIGKVEADSLEKWCQIKFGNQYSNPTYQARDLYVGGELVTDLVIPGTVSVINPYAFYSLDSLKTINIPDSVTQIGANAFYMCSGVSEIYFHGAMPVLNSSAFLNNTKVFKYECDKGWNDTEAAAVNTSWKWEKVHADVSESNKIEPGCTEEGSADYTCSACGLEWSETLAPIGVGTMSVEGLESQHNYKNGMDQSWVIELPDGGKGPIEITFDENTNVENGYDYIYIYDSNDKQVARYSGTKLAGVTVTVNSDSARIRMTSDGSGVEYGFKVTNVKFTGHTWDEGVTTTEPTCEEDGVKTYTCINDASHQKTEVIEKLGHNWNEGMVTKAAACEEDGVKTFTCQNDASHQYTEVIDMLGHSWDNGAATTPATCEADGVMTYTCQNDASHYYTEAITKLGHKWGKGVVTKEPTCNAEGEMLYTCENDSNHTRTETIGMLEHEYAEDWTTTESEHWRGCTHDDCEAKDSYGEHSWIESVTVVPGCETTGEMVKKCSICGYVASTEEIEADGHQWAEDTTVDVPATFTEDGVKSIHCIKCDATKDEAVIEKFGDIKVKLSKTSFTYNGKTQKPAVTVLDTEGNVLDSELFVVDNAGRKLVGKGAVTVTVASPEYMASKVVTYKINPKGTSIKSLTAGKKYFTAKWAKQSTQTTGYQIRYSLKSSMASAKTVTVTKNTTVSKKVTKLSSKKKYYVQVRTYKTVSGVKYYSAWSAKKYVKVK